jgi:hypothetical protein
MSNSATSIDNIAMQTIPKDEWILFLADFTQRNRGAHARLEIIGNETGYLVETENRPFDGVSADVKDGEETVWISFGASPDDSLAHGVQRVVTLYALRGLDGSGEVLAGESRDGSRTVLYLSSPADFALPAADS